jgi:hypothetical protein
MSGTYFTLHANHHGTAKITARTLATLGEPLILEVCEADSTRIAELTIFTGDAALAVKLAEVINSAQATANITSEAA